MSETEFYADEWQSQVVGMYGGLKTRTEKLQNLGKGMSALVSSNQIYGAGADQMKAYISEVHLSLISSLLTTIQTFQTATGVYWNGYKEIDNNGNFKLVREDLQGHITQLNQGIRDMDSFQNRLQSVASSVDDILYLGGAGSHSLDNVKNDFEDMLRTVNTQMSQWEAYEQSNEGLDKVEEMIGQVKNILTHLSKLSVGTGRTYMSGSFKQTMDLLGNLMNGMNQFNENNAEIASEAWNNLFVEYAKDVDAAQKKAQKEANKRDGWASLFIDVAFLALGAAITIATGGLAAPLIFVAGAAVFTAAEMGADLHKAFSGKSKGYNFIKDGLMHDLLRMPDAVIEPLYNATSFVATLAAGGAFKGLANEGYMVSENMAKPLLKPALQTAKQSGVKSALKLYQTTLLQNTKLAIANKGLAEGILPKINPIVKQGLFGTSTKPIAKTFISEGAKKLVYDNTMKPLKAEFVTKPLSEGIQEMVGTKGQDDLFSLTANKAIHRVTSSAVDKIDGKTLNTKKVTGSFARTLLCSDAQERVARNFAEMKENGYQVGFSDSVQNVWKSVMRENSGVVWK